ncbi:hypothetical protein [Deinococcus altitudinis]|uniref:hypothetical protein n=1 Tax=Deinococcus altitudinis TaxID=468914 RepID=UPI0038913FFD
MKSEQIPLRAQDFEVGEVVMCWDIRSEVLRVSGKKVRVKILDGGAAGMTVLAMPELLKKID